VRSDIKSAILPDSTVSERWEERNAKAKAKVKVNKTIKIHVEGAVLDFDHVKK
jgi:hypothetical protein